MPKGLVISNYYGGTAKAIAQALGWKVSLADATKERNVRCIINYGTTTTLRLNVRNPVLMNLPGPVQEAVDKKQTLELLAREGIPTLTFTDKPEVALAWLTDGRSIVCRKVLNGHSGQGIDIIKFSDWKADGKRKPQIPEGVKLFTRYFPKQEEVRVHVFRGEIIGYAAKRKKRAVGADNWVRTHGNGWVFATEGVVRNEQACDAAQRSVVALGLDFGAVDVGIGRDGVAVFEVNSAPGMEGRTLQAYVSKFKQHYGVR
jgi:glutathione synthase/RimK-type ligase-like ATP-grasp enzyme